jgi:hypothetical protein
MNPARHAALSLALLAGCAAPQAEQAPTPLAHIPTYSYLVGKETGDALTNGDTPLDLYPQASYRTREEKPIIYERHIKSRSNRHGTFVSYFYANNEKSKKPVEIVYQLCNGQHAKEPFALLDWEHERGYFLAQGKVQWNLTPSLLFLGGGVPPPCKQLGPLA